MRGASFKIAVPLLPFISNFDDLDPLRLEPGVSVEMIPRGKPLPAGADVILLPGSKATIADLEAFRAEGWDIDLAAPCPPRRARARALRRLSNAGPRNLRPRRHRRAAATVPGPRLSRFCHRAHGREDAAPGERHRLRRAVRGLRDACGRKPKAKRLSRPFLHFEDGRPEGAISADGRVAGCYVHGLFASDAFRAAWLAALLARAPRIRLPTKA